MHLIGGETSSSFTTPTIALGYSTTGRYPQYIHTRHNSNNATSNAIDFYTSAGTSDNFSSAVHGMTIMNGSVGIGTTSPGYALHVSGGSSPSTFNLGVNNSAGGYTNLYMNLSAVSGGYASIQAVQSSGSAYGNLILNGSGGCVGIGTTNPDGTLVVRAAADKNFMISPTANVTGAFRLAAVNDANGAYTPFEIDASQTSFMTGNVGIGTTAPAQALDVGSGNIKMGYYTPGNIPATIATNIAAQVWSSYVTVCPGNGFVISASCWAGPPFPSCPWAVNSSGQLQAFNCNASASATLFCNFICANIR